MSQIEVVMDDHMDGYDHYGDWMGLVCGGFACAVSDGVFSLKNLKQ